MSESEELKKVEELRPGLRGINLKIKCGTKNDEKEVVSKQTGETLRVTEAIVGDESGSILMTLWNDDIDKMVSDHVYKVSNAYTTVFKTSLRLNIGKYGAFEEIQEEVTPNFDDALNTSKKEYQQRPRSGPGFEGGRPRDREEGGRPYRGDRGDRGDRGRDRGDRGRGGFRRR